MLPLMPFHKKLHQRRSPYNHQIQLTHNHSSHTQPIGSPHAPHGHHMQPASPSQHTHSPQVVRTHPMATMATTCSPHLPHSTHTAHMQSTHTPWPPWPPHAAHTSLTAHTWPPHHHMQPAPPFHTLTKPTLLTHAHLTLTRSPTCSSHTSQLTHGLHWSSKATPCSPHLTTAHPWSPHHHHAPTATLKATI